MGCTYSKPSPKKKIQYQFLPSNGKPQLVVQREQERNSLQRSRSHKDKQNMMGQGRNGKERNNYQDLQKANRGQQNHNQRMVESKLYNEGGQHLTQSKRRGPIMKGISRAPVPDFNPLARHNSGQRQDISASRIMAKSKIGHHDQNGSQIRERT